ncbi:traB domain-containing protein [Malaya genurostris]|uniref:traB domain-containing protein n=1 Tax=Malaya genurostris TaxID=325434 RepID=UPI0026F397A6|nr:traB domain-containing protein [Malaya genurostris]XP_058465499.1 traB domain-containing protein [Malaya genurostris]XP_058465509.1 traB domain-containing protein [Malaya genurostris]
MSSPISSASEYNSALDETLNSSFNSQKLDFSLTESDIENVNLSQEWKGIKKPKSKKTYNAQDESQQLLDSLKNNNYFGTSQQMATEKSPSKSSNNETLDSTLSMISLDISGTEISGDGSSTLSFLSSSDEASAMIGDEEVYTGSTASSSIEGSSSGLNAPKPSPHNVSQVSGQLLEDESLTTKDSKDTTHNVSLLPTDDDQLTVLEHSQKNPIKIYSSIEEFDRNLPDTVTLLTTPEGSKVYLVGTAHFSENSQNDVSLVMQNVQPQVVMLELCPSRIHILKYDEQALLEEAKDINLSKIQTIIKRNGAINGLFYILLLNMSAKITKKLGMAPGGEFRRAVNEASRIPKCIIQLGDRQINITLQRALRGLSLWQTVKLIPKLLIMDDISIEDVEQCKQKDLLEEIMLELAGEFPAFGRVFVEERDLYLCYSLQVAAMPQQLEDEMPRPVNVVGVVGIGHAAGIIKHWGKVERTVIDSIITIPPTSFSHRAAKFVLKYGTLGLCAYGAFRFVRPRLSRWL